MIIELPTDEKFSQEKEIQQGIIILLLSPGKNFLPIYIPYLKPDLWENYILKDIAKTILDYFIKYNTIITFPIIKHSILEMLALKNKTALGINYFAEIEELETKSIDIISEMPFYEDYFIDFIQRQQYKKGALDILGSLQKGKDISNIETITENMINTPKSVETGYNLLNSTEENLNLELNTNAPIATLFSNLDNSISDGLTAGELGIIMGAPGMGKTSLLTRFGVAAAFQGKNVFHYTIETPLNEIKIKYLQAISGATSIFKDNDISSKEISTDVLNKLNWLSGFRGNLILHEFPSPKTLDIESHINVCMAQGIKPDIVLVDQIDDMEPNKTQKWHSEWAIPGEVCKDLIALGKRYFFPVWATTWANREAFEKEYVTEKHMGGSFDKVKRSTVLLALCQTKKDIATEVVKGDLKGWHEPESRQVLGRGILRVFLTKNRRGPKYIIIRIMPDFARMNFKQLEKLERYDEGTSYITEIDTSFNFGSSKKGS